MKRIATVTGLFVGIYFCAAFCASGYLCHKYSYLSSSIPPDWVWRDDSWWENSAFVGSGMWIAEPMMFDLFLEHVRGPSFLYFCALVFCGVTLGFLAWLLLRIIGSRFCHVSILSKSKRANKAQEDKREHRRP